MDELDDTLDADTERPAVRALDQGPVPNGTVLDGRYRIVGVLGRGTMGVVYRALEPELERQVAIKVLPRQVAQDTMVVERFRVEGRAMARVRHPNVVTVHAVGEHDGSPYMVMELVDGDDLRHWVRERPEPLSPREALAVLEPIAAGVQAIHDAGAVHGDVKPANVMRSRSGRIAVTDLGLARILEAKDVRQTLEVVGTPKYMAPEILMRERVTGELHRRVDVYSLGVIAYELLAGAPPFDSDDYVRVLNMHATQAPRPPSERRPELSPLVDRVVLSALEKDPRLRVPSAKAFIEQLAAAIEASVGGSSLAVVDDDEDFVEFVRAVLEETMPGIRLTAYPDCPSAIAGLAADPPDAALIDLQLPDGSGIEVLAQLGADLDPRPRIALVTAVGGAKDWAVAKRIGADMFLAKPLEPEDLEIALRRLLESPRLPTPASGSRRPSQE